jgi:hypothetical protein
VTKPEQKKIPKENWNRFTVPADTGIFVVLIPDPDPAQLAQLDGKELKINIFERNRIRETRKIPIKIAPDLRALGPQARTELEPGPGKFGIQTRPDEGVARWTPELSEAGKESGRRETPATEPPGTLRRWGGTWIWIFQVFNLILLIGLAGYGIFFILPKVQVLEDRLAKNEMFIHGTREAIREELDQIKEEILRQCQQDAHPE